VQRTIALDHRPRHSPTRRAAGALCQHNNHDTATGLIHAAITRAQAGQLPVKDTELAELAAALTDPAVRDDSLRYSLPPTRRAAERLWTTLLRVTPPPHRAEQPFCSPSPPTSTVTARSRRSRQTRPLDANASTPSPAWCCWPSTPGYRPEHLHEAITSLAAFNP